MSLEHGYVEEFPISKSNVHAALETWLRSMRKINDHQDVEIDLEASGDSYIVSMHIKEADLSR